MKALFILTLAASLSAFAQSESFEARMQETDKKIQTELDRTYQSKDGIEIRNVKKSLLDQAIKKLDGNVTIEFGKDRQIPIPKSGSVVVGSGADGTIATSDSDANASVVLTVPLKPRMSLTIVGGKGHFCMNRIVKNLDGTIKRNSSSFYSSLENGGCNYIGKPIRPFEPGTYLVSVNDGLSEMFVEINQDENKVIPLREIVIPYAESGDDDILFKIYRDFESSDVEREKLVQRQFAQTGGFGGCNQDSVCAQLGAITTLEKFRPYFGVVASTESAGFGVLSLDKTHVVWNLASIHFRSEMRLRSDAFTYQSQSYSNAMADNRSVSAIPSRLKEAYKYHVLPGVYGMRWKIGNNYAVTKGIYVQ